MITWTDGEVYGDIDSDEFVANISTDLKFGAFKIFSDSAGFVALTKNGSVVSWHGGIDKENKRTKGYKVPNLAAKGRSGYSNEPWSIRLLEQQRLTG